MIELPAEVEEALRKVIEPRLRPLRQHRAPFVKPPLYFRGCANCGTSLMATEGGAAERGPWDGWRWYCSLECAPERLSQDARP